MPGDPLEWRPEHFNFAADDGHATASAFRALWGIINAAEAMQGSEQA